MRESIDRENKNIQVKEKNKGEKYEKRRKEK